MEPEPFDPKDARQQFEIRKRGWGGYVAKSVAPDGFPPGFLRRKDAVVQREVIAVAGREVEPDERNLVGGIMWFRSSGNVGGEASVGLSLEIVERMKWEQERAGWLGGNESYVTVKRVEEFGGIGGWKKLGCYVLVERFVLRRMDGSLVLTYDFKHTHQIRSKWE
ncbi:hypothetical protein D5086_016362 [Populus alba]|uniref:Uncharacterized protein n=1 Tax=Populus alba TaxID=43335 RepID=A0ACC4BUH9_POPAL